MKIKILTPDENGKFSFTKAELEALLEEAYQEGYAAGKVDGTPAYRTSINGVCPDTARI